MGLAAASAALLNSSVPVTDGEVSTVRMLQDECARAQAAGERVIVYYAHTKGGCCECSFPVLHLVVVLAVTANLLICV